MTNDVPAVEKSGRDDYPTAAAFMPARVTIRSLEKVPHDTAAVLVEHGYLLPSTMNRERVSLEEIFDAIHNAGLERIDQVKWAILGTDGRISIIPSWQGEPVRRADTKPAV